MIQFQGLLGFINNDYDSDYFTLLSESHQIIMEVKRKISLCIEISKTQNGLNPKHMNHIFA